MVFWTKVLRCLWNLYVPPPLLTLDTPFADPLGPVIVIGAAVLFLITITAYRFYVRRENRLLDGTPEEVARVMKRGVTQEQVDMGWRYEGY